VREKKRNEKLKQRGCFNEKRQAEHGTMHRMLAFLSSGHHLCSRSRPGRWKNLGLNQKELKMRSGGGLKISELKSKVSGKNIGRSTNISHDLGD